MIACIIYALSAFQYYGVEYIQQSCLPGVGCSDSALPSPWISPYYSRLYVWDGFLMTIDCSVGGMPWDYMDVVGSDERTC